MCIFRLIFFTIVLKQNLAWKRQMDKESFDVDPHLPSEHKQRLAQLERKISKFAFYAIREEFKHRNILKTDNCRCNIKAHYDIPCCHMLPIGEIPLTLIPRRWHLYPEKTALTGNDINYNCILGIGILMVLYRGHYYR